GEATPTTEPAASKEDQGGEPGLPSGAFTYATAADLATFDPHAAQAGPQLTSYLTLVYDRLVLLDETLESQPLLAESWEYVEPTRLEFTLREGVTFSDGTPFDAHAAQANLERAKDLGGPRSVLLRNIDTVESIDDRHLVLTLARPDATL